MHDLIDSGVWAQLSATARTLYPVLCRFTNESFKAVWPGTDELLRLTGFKTKRSLQQAKKELVDFKLIDIVPGTGRTSTRYYFRFDYQNTSINLDVYRDTIVSPRGVKQETPGGYNRISRGDNKVSPNNIHININTNDNKKQETLLKNIDNNLNNFLNQNNKLYADADKQQIIQTMLKKYGELEIGEAVKIAIRKGKNGDINYLEGILKNRKNDQTEKTPKTDESSNIEQIINQNFPDYKNLMQPYYRYGDVHYYKSNTPIDKRNVEKVLKKHGLNIKIICPEQNIQEPQYLTLG